MSAQRILTNFGFLASGRSLAHAAALLLFVVLSRAFGPEGIGAYSFAMAFTGFFAVVADFGLYALTLKELSRGSDAIGDAYAPILVLRTVLSVAVLAFLLLSLELFGFPRETSLIIAAIGVFQLAQRLTRGYGAAFLAREDSRVAAALDASLGTLAPLAVIGAVAAGANLQTALIALPLVAVCHAALGHWWLVATRSSSRRRVSCRDIIEVAQDAIPYAFSGLLTQLSRRIDVLLLGFLLGTIAAGIYNVAFRVALLPLLVLQFSAVALFPRASKLHASSPREFEKLYHRALGVMVLLGIPATFGLALVAPAVVIQLFGEGLAESTAILRILAALVAVRCASRVMAIFLMSSDRQALRTKLQLIAALAHILSNAVLIPWMGIAGAAVATIGSELLVLVLLAAYLSPTVGWPRVGHRALLGLTGSALFCAIFSALPRLPLAVVLSGSVGAYLAVLALSPDVRRNELTTAVRWLRRSSG